MSTQPATSLPPLPSSSIVPRWARWASLVVVCAYVLAIAPTLSWVEFSNGSENLNVATALEVERTGNWLVPTLEGEPRIQKPPLTAWLTAAAITDGTMRGLSSSDPVVRDRAARTLAWQTRWTALAATCFMLLAVFWLGQILDGWQFGLIAAMATGTTVLVLRFGRFATTDVQLALWVSVTNAFLALAIVRHRWWLGFAGAGVALGLAFMSKGPVALVQTALPVAAFVSWQRFAEPRKPLDPKLPALRISAALVVGVLLMLVVGLSWFAFVLVRSGEAGRLWAKWTSEVTRVGATRRTESDPWFNYLAIVPLVFPWIAFLVVGLILAVRDMSRRSARPIVMSVFLLVIPVIIMSLFPDRVQRYLLPLAGPAGLVIAWGVREHMRSWWRWTMEDTIVVTIHWLGLAVVAVGLPIAGALEIGGLETITGRPWYTIPFAAGASALGLGLVLLFALLHRRWRGGLVVGTFVIMLVVHAIAMRGYAMSAEGHSELRPLAEAILATHPDAETLNAEQDRRVPSDFSVYMNRSTPAPPDARSREPVDRPLVLLVYQPRNTPEPQTPTGWTPLAKTERNRNWWHAYVKEPTTAR